MAGGRPSKYNPDMCAKALDIFKEGKSIRNVAAKLGIHRDTLYEYMKIHPEFSDTVSHGLDLAFAYLEDKLFELIENKSKYNKPEFNAVNMALRTRFHEVYGDRHKIDQTVDQTTSIEIKIDSDDEQL